MNKNNTGIKQNGNKPILVIISCLYRIGEYRLSSESLNTFKFNDESLAQRDRETYQFLAWMYKVQCLFYENEIWNDLSND